MASDAAGSPTLYIMSRFPKLTETFVLDEMLEMKRIGTRLLIMPLWRERAAVTHADVQKLMPNVSFLPTLNLGIVRDNAWFLWRRPGKLLSVWGTLLRHNAASARYLAGALAILPKVASMARRAENNKVAHIHAHFASHPAAAAYAINKLTGIPFSFTAHGSDLHRDQAMLAEKVAQAGLVVTISDYNRQFIQRYVPEAVMDKVEVVRCGVDAEEFPEYSGRTSAVLQIGCIGTLHEVKGQHHLLAACARLQGEYHLHLIGDGPDRAKLEALCRSYNLNDKVTFHGYLERGAVKALLGNLDVVCAPSVKSRDGRREGIPVVLIEAAAAARPMIASRLSGIPELVVDGETGKLVEPGNVEEIAAALSWMMVNEQEALSLGRRAKSMVKAQFDLRANVARLRSLMLSVTGGAL